MYNTDGTRNCTLHFSLKLTNFHYFLAAYHRSRLCWNNHLFLIQWRMIGYITTQHTANKSNCVTGFREQPAEIQSRTTTQLRKMQMCQKPWISEKVKFVYIEESLLNRLHAHNIAATRIIFTPTRLYLYKRQHTDPHPHIYQIIACKVWRSFIFTFGH